MPDFKSGARRIAVLYYGTVIFAILLFAQDPVVIDRGAMKEFAEKKNLKVEDFKFDLDHLESMPPNCVAHYTHPKRENGKLKIFLEVQKDPITFPERMQKIASRSALGVPELFAAADELLGRAPKKVELPMAEPAADLPEKVALAVGRIQAAMKTDDPATIARVVLEVRADLVHTGRYESGDLVIDFDGDDTHTFEKPRNGVFIDVAGNDRYEGHVAAAQNGISMVFDFAGNDTWVSEGNFAQAAAYRGTALLYEGGGNDKYILGRSGQAYAQEGVAALVDVSGNDTYEITSDGQGYGQWDAVAILVDLDGDDSYLGRDPLNGHPVTVPAPQDEKHNANMVQGAGLGLRGQTMKAGGVGILLDVRGDDTYRSGCWSQGVGYFMGLGALIDLEGDDTYESWVYIMGSGAHGGFGLQVDAKGDDTYTVGGWNCLGMAVDYGIGMFLDGAGHDKYLGAASGPGRSIGLGIALFQDGGGDDVHQPKDPKLGWGQWYEREDYNFDDKITPAEKRHWGVFFDLGGMDRYPKEYKNATRWDGGEFWGGIDRASPASPLVSGIKDWEDMDPAALFAGLKKKETDLKALAAFAFDRGFVKEGSELLFKAGGKIEGAVYEPSLRLWVPDKDRAWVATLADYRAKLLKVPVGELLAAKPIDGPKWVRRECREIITAVIAERKSAGLERVRKWTATLKPLLDKRAALDEARAKDEKKLRQLWTARKQGSVKVPAEARDAAKELDKLDSKWRVDVPLASNLSEESLTLENFTLTEPERAQLVRAKEIEKKNESAKGSIKKFAEELNAFRAMYGRGALEVEPILCKVAETGLRMGKDAGSAADRVKAAGFDGEVTETTAKGLEASDRAILLDTKWTHVGLSVSTQGVWWIDLGRKK